MSARDQAVALWAAFCGHAFDCVICTAAWREGQEEKRNDAVDGVLVPCETGIAIIRRMHEADPGYYGGTPA